MMEGEERRELQQGVYHSSLERSHAMCSISSVWPYQSPPSIEFVVCTYDQVIVKVG